MRSKTDSKKVYAVFILMSTAIALLGVVGFQFIYERFMNMNGFPGWVGALISIALFLATYHLIKKYFMRNAFSCRLGADDLPDISGRWVGFLTSSYKRDGQNVIVPITLEIKQNISSILVRAYFEKGYSESVMTGFEVIGSGMHLSYIYDNAIPGKSNGLANRDKGAVMLEYFDEDKRILKGTYFNDLRPQSNHGEIRVSYSGSQLLDGIK